jgi:uncharacterized repeat protein (TIGR01451 family)
VSQPAVIAGTEVTYHIEISNTGNVDLHNVLLDDPLVPECGDEIVSLSVGESVTVSCATTIWAPITNTATATGEDPFGTPVSDDGSATVTLLSSGTGTPGFWKNHQEVWPVSGGGVLVGDWNHNKVCDTDEVCLGLTAEEALEAVSTPPRGDMTWNLSRHLVTAWLNVTSGNESACIRETIDSATQWLLDHPLGSDVSGGADAWTAASGWAETLDEYNNGRLCAEHRDADAGEAEQVPAGAHGNRVTNVEQPIPEAETDKGTTGAVPGKAIGRPDHPGKNHKEK